jgi:hypothetical protein
MNWLQKLSVVHRTKHWLCGIGKQANNWTERREFTVTSFGRYRKSLELVLSAAPTMKPSNCGHRICNKSAILLDIHPLYSQSNHWNLVPTILRGMTNRSKFGKVNKLSKQCNARLRSGRLLWMNQPTSMPVAQMDFSAYLLEFSKEKPPSTSSKPSTSKSWIPQPRKWEWVANK